MSSVETLYEKASPKARAIVEEILTADADDQAWLEQLGPALTGATVARMLGVSPQAVSTNKGLLRLKMRSGRVGYPIFQFKGRSPIPGLGAIVRQLEPVVATEWTTASWLTTPNSELDGDTPVEALRLDKLDAAMRAAQRFATALAN
ncbi:MAG: hypothetical protein V9F03_05370 [Microthrixaceae bacterium]